MGNGGSRGRGRRLLTALLIAGLFSMVLFSRPPERAPSRARPSAYPVAAEAEAERTETSEHFSATWINDPSSPDAPALRDRNRDGIPDSIQTLLGAFETARAFLLNDLGYRPPPTSGPYRLYVVGREGPAVTKPAPGGSGASRPSFTVIPRAAFQAYSPSEFRVLAAHEYFHAVQNGYAAGEEHWISEASAVWVQDVFDDRLDSNHWLLPSFVPQPRTTLTDIDGDHEYGAFLFIQFLVERYAGGNPDLVRELWEHMATTDALGAVEAVLSRRGVSFADAWAEFLLWRWDLDRFEEGAAYRSALGNDWPTPLQAIEVNTESCPLGTELPALSGDYAVFTTAERPDSAKATVTVEGPPGATAFALAKGENGDEKVQLLRIGQDGLASARVRFGDDQVKRVILGVGNPGTGDKDVSFGYSLRILGREAVTAVPLAPPPDTSYFGGLSLRGRVSCPGRPASSADIVLVQEKTTGERREFPLQTLPGGTWFVNIQPEASSTYHVEVVDPLLSSASSQPWDVAVRVALTLEATHADVALGEPATVAGAVNPPHPGALVVIEYRRPDLSWRSGPQTTVGPDGTYRAEVLLPGSGIWHLRATLLDTGDTDHIGSSTIQDVFVNVR